MSEHAPGPTATERTTTPDPATTTTPPTTPTTTSGKADNPLRGSRTSAVWSGVVGLGILLVLLIIFIAQNTQKADVTFLGWTGTAPQAVLLLIATVSGLALAVTAASLRILQLRRRVRRAR